MGKCVSCLAFTWSRSHDYTTDQSYHLQYTISLFHSSLRMNATCDSQHSPLLNKRSTHKEIANPNIYFNIISSYIRLLTTSYHVIIMLRGAKVTVLTWMQQVITLILWKNTWMMYYSTSCIYESVGVLIRCCNCIITAIGN